MAFHIKSIYCDKKCVEEINRLRATIGMDPLPEPNVKPPIAAKFPKKVGVVKNEFTVDVTKVICSINFIFKILE